MNHQRILEHFQTKVLGLGVNGITKDSMTALLTAFIQLGGMHFQANSVSREVLEDAMAHPENHLDLYVRVYGLSLRFITLTDEFKKEMISRPEYR